MFIFCKDRKLKKGKNLKFVLQKNPRKAKVFLIYIVRL